MKDDKREFGRVRFTAIAHAEGFANEFTDAGEVGRIRMPYGEYDYGETKCPDGRVRRVVQVWDEASARAVRDALPAEGYPVYQGHPDVPEVAAKYPNKAATWGGASGSDPDMDLAGMLLAGGDASGIDPNRILMGKAAWQKRLVALREKDTAGAFASSGMTPEQLAGFLACDEVYVNKERFQSGTAKQNLVGSGVVLGFMAEQGMGKDDPSNIKRFVSAQDGGPFRVFRQELTSHLIQISVSHYSNIVLTSNLGLRKLTVS